MFFFNGLALYPTVAINDVVKISDDSCGKRREKYRTTECPLLTTTQSGHAGFGDCIDRLKGDGGQAALLNGRSAGKQQKDSRPLKTERT